MSLSTTYNKDLTSSVFGEPKLFPTMFANFTSSWGLIMYGEWKNNDVVSIHRWIATWLNNEKLKLSV